MTRDTVSAPVVRAVLVEAGHRWAIPTCRATTTEIAHIAPWAETKDNSFENSSPYVYFLVPKASVSELMTIDREMGAGHISVSTNLLNARC
jgi:hypothetical protein